MIPEEIYERQTERLPGGPNYEYESPELVAELTPMEKLVESVNQRTKEIAAFRRWGIKI